MARQGTQDAAACPACDRFIGPAARCPYCGTDSARRPAQRFLRVAALLFALTGTAALYTAAVRSELPVSPVADITPTMHYAQVRVVGVVERDAYISRKHGRVDYLSFSVDDGTDALRVSAYRNTARALVQEDKIPERGDRVDVAGRLSVPPDGRVRLNLQAATRLVLLPPDDTTGDR